MMNDMKRRFYLTQAKFTSFLYLLGCLAFFVMMGLNQQADAAWWTPKPKNEQSSGSTLNQNQAQSQSKTENQNSAGANAGKNVQSAIAQPLAKPLATDPEVVRIRQQIQDIIKINDEIKGKYNNQSAEIQRISEQAQIHQRILTDLETAKNVKRTYTPTDATEIVRQEKLRLIEDQTKRNKRTMEKIKGNTSKTKEPSSEKEEDDEFLKFDNKNDSGSK